MQLVKSWIKAALARRGYMHSYPPGQFQLHSHKLRRAKELGLDVRFAIDGGAARGNWAVEFRQVYPDAKVLMIEPRDEMQPLLQRLCREDPGFSVVQTLVGDHEGVASFNVSGQQSSLLPNSKGERFGKMQEFPITTLDRVVQNAGCPQPDLIKLDLQGAELQCLDGASACLAKAQALVLEVSFIPLQKGNPLVAEVFSYLAQRGFRAYDLLGLLHRPLDRALAQADVLFVSNKCKLAADNRWSAESAWA